MNKTMSVIFYRQNHLRPDWNKVDLAGADFAGFFSNLQAELAEVGVKLQRQDSDLFTIDINSYADLLNAVRISSPSDGFGAVCVGHIIGKSERLDLTDDIRRAVNRIAFAPETVPPEDHNRRVCHNCGCGC